MQLVSVLRRLLQDTGRRVAGLRGKNWKQAVCDFLGSRIFKAIAASAVLHGALVAGLSYRSIYRAVAGQPASAGQELSDQAPAQTGGTTGAPALQVPKEPATEESSKGGLAPTGKPEDYEKRMKLDAAKPDEIPKTPEDINPFKEDGKDFLTD